MGLYLSVLEVLIDSLGVVYLWCPNILFLFRVEGLCNLLWWCMFRLVLRLGQTSYCGRILSVVMGCLDNYEDILSVVFQTNE